MTTRDRKKPWSEFLRNREGEVTHRISFDPAEHALSSKGWTVTADPGDEVLIRLGNLWEAIEWCEDQDVSFYAILT